MFFEENTEGSPNLPNNLKKSYEWRFVRLFALSLSNNSYKTVFLQKILRGPLNNITDDKTIKHQHPRPKIIG